MRLFLALVVFVQLLFTPLLFSQPVDSLARAVDSSQKKLQQSVDDFNRLQDSIEKIRLQRNLEQNGQSMDDFLQEMKEKEKNEKQQLYIRIGLGIAFLLALLVGFARRRKKKQNSA